ncbi:phosphoribosyltransferase family protein [Micromonospora sp. NPDC005215]|uniref:phosphoribosyltransferase n=1 Tax=Micromonospora sp. NPDC005215 TaxID=3157024 RepID=UPI0033AE5989
MNVVSLVISSIAGLISIFFSIRLVRERNKISWRMVETCTRSLLEEIQASSFDPDVVIGVGRGGAILGGMLAGNMGHLPLFVVDTILDRTDGVSAAHIRYPGVLPDLAGKKLLLAVGELYSGQDLRAALDLAKSKSPSMIKTVSLFSHPASSIRPDYVGRETRQPLSAPWRMSDVYRTRRL